MNQKLIANYLHFLRTSNNLTQEDLAHRLSVTRQAVSKWETGGAVPDTDTLLKLSKLYGITINEILEPHMAEPRIRDFEEIVTLDRQTVIAALSHFPAEALVKACMGASPRTNAYLEALFPEISISSRQQQIGRIRVEDVEEQQANIVYFLNLWENPGAPHQTKTGFPR